MSNIKPEARPSGVTIRSDAQGITVTNSRGHEIRIAVSPSTEGFNPLELQAAALGVCTTLGLRREAAALTAQDALPDFKVSVQGFKAKSQPSRVERFELKVAIDSAIDSDAKQGIVSRAEQACTIATTLRSPTRVDAVLVESAPVAAQAV